MLALSMTASRQARCAQVKPFFTLSGLRDFACASCGRPAAGQARTAGGGTVCATQLQAACREACAPE